MKETEYRALPGTTMLTPLPVALLTCRRNREERTNILTAAWCGTVNTHPPMLSVSVRPERYSYGLILESGEFVMHPVDEDHVRAADFCGVRSGRDTDKLTETGMTCRAAEGLSTAQALTGLPLSLSCRVRDRIPLGSHDLFLADVVCVQVRSDLFDSDGSLHLERAGLVCYNHGVYQGLSDVLGFFGYSVARPHVLEKRMRIYRSVRRCGHRAIPSRERTREPHPGNHPY